MEGKGIVYLVGAGPGDPGLMTVKGLHAIQKADVIVYDRLAIPRLLKEAHPEAEQIYVGKLPDQHTFTQSEINQILVKKAKEGKIVVRLKGGDPFIFGRGGEEAEELVQAEIPFEVIPGITSAIAVPAYAGIPVTHRDYNSSFAVVTGHERPEKNQSTIRWEQLATATETIIFLMGVKNLSFIVEQLQRFGRSSSTPIALVRWGTRIEQETITGTLADIVEKVERQGFRSPAVIVVGEVVQLREQLQWFENKPLFGKRILVTRSRTQSSTLAQKIELLGGEAIEFPVIRTQKPKQTEETIQALQRLHQFDWAVFTSVNGVHFFFSHLQDLQIDIRKLAKARIAAIGPQTKQALLQYGLQVDALPEKYHAESMLETLLKVVKNGDRVLLPRADLARNVLPEGLQAIGCEVTAFDAYHTVVDAENAEEVRTLLKNGKIDMITFTSSSTVKNFMQSVSISPDALQGIEIACIGPITATTAEQFGLSVDKTATEYTIDGLLQVILGGNQ